MKVFLLDSQTLSPSDRDHVHHFRNSNTINFAAALLTPKEDALKLEYLDCDEEIRELISALGPKLIAAETKLIGALFTELIGGLFAVIFGLIAA